MPVPTRPLGNDEFTRIRAPLVWSDTAKAYYRDWDNATETTISGCSVQPFRLAEKLNFEINKEREFSRTGLRFFAPAGTDIDADDRIIYRGREYAVFGHHGDWTDFDGTVNHVAFLARRREG